jgi:FAD:protein FMN transferase
MTSEAIITARCRAMATYFEVALWGKEEQYLTTVGEQVIEEIHRLEQQLSMYREDSDVYELNFVAAYRPVVVEPRLFALLKRAKELSEATGGACDITIGPLLQAWGFVGGTGEMANEEAVAAARELTGMHLVELDEEERTVRFLREGVRIDLGAIGKGYAIEQAAELLREYEVPGALVHGGTSTVQAVGAQPDGNPWSVAVKDPTDGENHLTVVQLIDRALSISAVHGKSFTEGGVQYGHVLDPRTGAPTQGALLAGVVTNSATESDALSTALLVLGEAGIPVIRAVRPDAGVLLALPDAGVMRVITEL